MSDLRAAAQQALETIKRIAVLVPRDDPQAGEAITALKAALAEPVQEPYCYVYEYDGVFGLHREFYPKPYNGMKPSRTVPVYTAPPQRNDINAELVEALQSIMAIDGYSSLSLAEADAIYAKARAALAKAEESRHE